MEVQLKFWVIQVTEHWDDRGDSPKGPPFPLPGRVFLFRKPCQWEANGWNVASDHNHYDATSIEMSWAEAKSRGTITVGWRWFRYGLPRSIGFHWANWKSRMLSRMPDWYWRITWVMRRK